MRYRLASLALLLVSALLPPSAIAAPNAFVLRVGEPVFWNGPYIEEAQTIGQKGCSEGCYVYEVDVTTDGHKLRVALDYPMNNDMFALRLIDPNGHTHKPGRTGLFSQEIFAKYAPAGIWKVQVKARFASRTAFRLRALLEEHHRRPATPQLLAPNLRLEPPFDFSFRAPVTMVGGATVFGPNPGNSCGADETAEYQSVRCLRMSVGPQNTGLGPLELRFSPAADAVTAEAPMYQVLHYSDGVTRERPAGTYEYHVFHGHYHFAGFANLELFKVTDRSTGEMESAGQGHKSGFCFGDVMMNSWHSFRQGHAQTTRSSCDDMEEAYMGLTAGWTDIYSWDTPGNYVDFGTNPDGYYVVRAIVDAAHKIKESDETDNISYAYIEVEGDKVHVIERGFGTDPWDPYKSVAIDWVKQLRRAQK